jgi:hypothetical protein
MRMDSSASGALDPSSPASFVHPIFAAAMADLGALGVRASYTSGPNTQPYAVIGGRSNARWWLLPLETGSLTASGLALFQPLVPAARWMKALAAGLSRAHLQHVWAWRKVYLSYGPELAGFAERGDTARFAFFTGTDSPHRKVAVQIMDKTGKIHAFAKVTRNPDVAALLMHEASVLRRLESLPMRSVAIPRLLRSERINDATVLVTDTLKTPKSRSATELTAAHIEFARELSQVTQGATRALSEIGAQYRKRMDRVHARLHPAWQQRLLHAVNFLFRSPLDEVPTSMCHGDFTPWNTFSCERGLYVFDWEYAADGSLPGHDIAHFVLNATSSLAMEPSERYETARQHVLNACTGLRPDLVDLYLVAYLLSLCLRYIERAPVGGESIEGWESEQHHAALLDHALSRRTAPPQ